MKHEEFREDISKAISFICDAFAFNSVKPAIGAEACLQVFTEIMVNPQVKEEEIDTTLKIIKKNWKKGMNDKGYA